MTTKYCRIAGKNVEILGEDGLPPGLYCFESNMCSPTMCERKECVFHSAVGMAASFQDMVRDAIGGGGFSAKRSEA